MSSSIDEKIVSIKFNNAQFEAGIRTTMTSLDGLKKTLNFDAGVRALNDLDSAGKKITPPKFDGTAFNAGVQTTIKATDDLKSNLKFDGAVKGLNDLDNAGKKVNLKLDATTFQAGAKAVVDAASTVKQNLNFESVQRGFGILKTSISSLTFDQVVTGAKQGAKALADLDLAGKAVSFLPIEQSAEKAKGSISAMSVAGIAALATLASKAVTVGLEMGKSLFIDPAKSGLEEYETNLGSIQTIMSNTQWENKSLGDVNGALDELNNYSDKTIYNFSEMAKNIGTFTAAGVSLDDSTAAIKGISNLAAISGSNSQQASTAMYQLSQAMSAGKVGLEDWNSVVNAGMGGKVFQDALIETAKNQGTNVDYLIKKNGSFRQSLQEGWVTTKVMNETLAKMTGDLTDDQLRAMGYNDEQIVGIQKMAKSAQDAATKIKTFTQLTGTLQEQTGSGWAQTWKFILGDYEQAKEMWTNVYNAIGPVLQASSDARNKLLGDWNALGGRTEMIWAVSKAFDILMSVLKPIGQAFREVFPPTTGEQLYKITQGIRQLLYAIAPGPDQINLIHQSFKLLFTIIKIGVDIFKGALSVVWAFFKAFATGGDSVAGSLKPITDGLAAFTKRIQDSKFVEDFFKNLATVATALGAGLAKIIPPILRVAGALYQLGYDLSGNAMYYVSFFARMLASQFVPALNTAIDVVFNIIAAMSKFAEAVINGARAFLHGGINAAVDAFKTSLSTLGDIGDAAMTRINERVASVQRMIQRLGDIWSQMMVVFGRFWDKILPIREAVAKLFSDLGEQLKAAFTDVNFNDTLDMVNTGLLAGLFLVFKNFFKKILGMGDGVKDGLFKSLDDSVKGITGVLDALSGTLEAMQQNLKADTLIKIATAIGIMTLSVVALSLLDSGKLTQALVGIGVMVAILSKAMDALDKISMGSGFLKLPFIAASMILLAIALGLLTIPVVVLSHLSWVELVKGLGGVAIMLAALSRTVESMSKNPADLIATGVGLMAIAIAVRILADAVSIMGALDLGSLIKGLFGVGTVLFALSKTVESMAKNPADLIATGLGIMAIAIGIKILASAVGDFGAQDAGSMVQGILALGIVLTLLQRFVAVINKAEIFQAAAAMVVLGIALKIISSAMGDFAAFSWEEIAKGLIVMTIALDGISKALARVPPNMLTSAIGFIAVAIALKILGSALSDFAAMGWEDIGKAMVVLAGSLILLSVALIAMEGTLTGAAAMGIAAVSMVLMAQALTMFAQLSWEQLLIGLAALAGIFVIFGLAGLVLAPIVPVITALAIAMGLFGLGLLGVGLGTMAFVAGLLALAAAGAIVGPVLVAVVSSILGLIPMAMEEMAKGIVAFAGVIGNAMPVFLQAFVALLNTLLQAIQMVFPTLMDTLWMVIVGLVGIVVRGIPLFVDAGMKIIVGILTGIGNNIGQLVNAAADVIVNFINGIANNIGRVIESGVNLIIKFVEGLASSVRNNSKRMSDAGLDLASAIIEGMVNGLGSMVGRVLKAVGDVANNVLNTAKDILGIHSPSREFFAIGRYSTMGWANAVDKYGGDVVDAHSSVATSALDTVKQTMSNIDGLLTSEVNLNPTIRPVLDLTSVKKDASQLDGMLSTNANIAIGANYDKATALATADRVRRETIASNTEAGTTVSSGDTYNYTQNVSSPKALNNAEIYRQNKNLISTVRKGAPVAG